VTEPPRATDIGDGWTIYPDAPAKALRYNHATGTVEERHVDYVAVMLLHERARRAYRDARSVWPDGWEQLWAWWMHPTSWNLCRQIVVPSTFALMLHEPQGRKLYGIAVDDSHTELRAPDLANGERGDLLLVHRAP
jgi:hypothetical protein